MIPLGILLVAAGAALSIATLAHDVRRQQIVRTEGAQLAPKRIAPEAHALAAVLLGVGLGLVAGWRVGLIGGAVHAALAYLVLRPWINR